MVEIPDDVAKMVAETLRADYGDNPVGLYKQILGWADLLDPQPPTLREQVAEQLRNTSVGHRWDMADAVLAVVANWLADHESNRPMPYLEGLSRVEVYARAYRAATVDAVCLIRGGGDRG